MTEENQVEEKVEEKIEDHGVQAETPEVEEEAE